MLNKKLSDLFQIRKQNPKRQEKHITYFDQNYFHCRLINHGINTQLIRIQTQLKQNGQPLDEIRCKWFIKNTQDFKQIQDVTSEYYQPCLDDVGSMQQLQRYRICVQIQPYIQGKKYKGITIMKQSQLIRIDEKLQQQLQAFLESSKTKFDGRIEAVFSQNPKYQSYQFPLEIKMHIIDNKIIFMANGQQFETACINQEFPNIQFIRKSFNSIILNYNEKQSMKISFFNNYSRDLFALIVRTCAAHFDKINPQFESEKQQAIIAKQQPTNQQIKLQNNQTDLKIQQKQKLQKNITNEEQIAGSDEQINKAQSKLLNCQTQSQQIKTKQMDDHIQLAKAKNTNCEQQTIPKAKSQQPKQSNTTLILRLDELNKQLKQNKRKFDQLSLNYNLQKQNKLQIESLLQETRQKLSNLEKQHNQSLKICKRIQQLSQDNRFYKNEISIMKKELKKYKETIKQLQNQMTKNEKSQANQYTNKLQEIKQINQKILSQNSIILSKKQQIEAQFEHFKQEYEKLNNQNKQLQHKITSLINQRRNNSLNSYQIIKQGNKIKQTEDKYSNEAEQKIQQLQMKLKNLQMLLKYKTNQGENSSNFQILVNKLTETITQKQIQLSQLKKINKNLLEQLKYFKNKF